MGNFDRRTAEVDKRLQGAAAYPLLELLLGMAFAIAGQNSPVSAVMVAISQDTVATVPDGQGGIVRDEKLA